MNALFRSRIMEMEEQMRQMPQVELELKHYFAQGLYAREMFIPKGILLTGLIHKQSQLVFVLKGDITIATEIGHKRFTAGETVVSPAGIKRAGYAHEDTIVTTVLGTHLTDPEQIKATLTCQSFQELLA
jgi:quercetin dioxygenase-like cupin family protein